MKKRPFLLNIGFSNVVSTSRIIAIVTPDSSPMKRLRDEAKKRGKLIDAKTRSIIITDSDHVILSALQVETITQRFFSEDAGLTRNPEKGSDE